MIDKDIRSANGNYYSSFKDFKNCVAESGSAFDMFIDIGLDTEVVVNGKSVTAFGTCPSDTLWFSTEFDHFEVDALPSGDIELNREDIESTDSWTQTTAGQASQEIGNTIKASYSSPLIQKLEEIQISDSVNGHDTELIKAYSNGGFHYRIRRINKATGVETHKVYLNCKLGTFPDTFLGADADTTYDLSFLIESTPLFVLIGDHTSLGLPEGSIDINLTGTAVTGTTNLLVTPTLTLSPEITHVSDTDIHLQIFVDGNEYPTQSETISTGTEATITLNEPVAGDIYVRAFLLNTSKSMLLYGTDLTVVPTSALLKTNKKKEDKIGE